VSRCGADPDIAKGLSGDISVVDNLNITRVTEKNGINGNPRNRYIWSMALDDSDNLYVGTLNQNYKSANLTSLIWSLVTSPFLKMTDSLVDTLLRQWSGLPIFESDGGQIYSKNASADNFTLQLQADPDHLGFRKMINYNGFIYAGSANGPEGPYDGESYDFGMYESNVGAKVSTYGIIDSRDLLDLHPGLSFMVSACWLGWQ
jgi:hypothetical protein